MDKNQEQYLDARLELLLRTVDFQELSQEERQFVMGLVSKEDYDNFRITLLRATDVFESDKLKSLDSEQNRLMAAFDEKHSSKEPRQLIAIGRFTLPLYKAAMIAAIFMGCFFLMGWKVSIEMHDQAVIHLTDTIYKEVLVPERIWLADSSTRANYFKGNDTNKAENIRMPVNKLQVPRNTNATTDNRVRYETARNLGIAPDIDFADRRRSQKRGKTLREDSVLSRFMVNVN